MSSITPGCTTAASPPLACACFYELLDAVDVLSGEGHHAVSRLDVQVAPCKAARLHHQRGESLVLMHLPRNTPSDRNVACKFQKRSTHMPLAQPRCNAVSWRPTCIT